MQRVCVWVGLEDGWGGAGVGGVEVPGSVSE